MFHLSFNFQQGQFFNTRILVFFIKYTHWSMLNSCREFLYWSHIINCQIREKTFLPNCRQCYLSTAVKAFWEWQRFQGLVVTVAEHYNLG